VLSKTSARHDLAMEGLFPLVEAVGQLILHRPPLLAVEPKDAYACSFRDGNKARTVAVLELPPVDLPELVVKIAIAAHARNKI
jgi:hypothetical protein